MCVFLILSVAVVTGLLGCSFLHPRKAVVFCARWSGCPWVQFEAGEGWDQPDHPAHLGLGTAKPGAGNPQDGVQPWEEGWGLCHHACTTPTNAC